MSLTKQDLKDIKGIVKETVSTEIDSFAIVVAKGFDEVHSKLREHDKRFEKIDERFDQNDSAHRSINARLDLIETDLSSLRSLHNEVKEIRVLLENTPSKEEFRLLNKRLFRVEKHLGLVK
ncbi:MAG: hypothetical protein UR93_C0003G0013 [Berkelbacteria bacterium GW2011_GWA2_35_9]|uniref:Uncharacterized protein n=1 Tax=Berkelbacteria bacterium GW2011_GWA2_35_9 TaxID=1618333 RepID=A0A0G0DJV0_9BACT|nr:MAG: hypothetical protein UR93_C0003G0013 [Berkelbacteria bacterium GW2011_GWA2_35_9]